MLLPIITEYNEADNTISATTDCLGTYCVMDMEKLLSSLAEPEEETKEAVPMMRSMNAAASTKMIVQPGNEFFMTYDEKIIFNIPVFSEERK